MPRRAKRRKPNAEPKPPSSSSSSETDSDEEKLNPQETIQIDLEARSLVDTDYLTVRYFLEQSFGNSMKKSVLDLSQLANQLVSQQSIGSVFYQILDSNDDGPKESDDDDETPLLGLCSFIQFNQQHNKQLHSWLLDKCSNSNQAQTILQNSKCGLLINERYMNIPADISLPAIRSLRSELPFQVDYWLIHAKLRFHRNDSTTILYMNSEEEIFNEYSTLSIDYHPPQSSNSEWTEERKIIFVSVDKLDQICSNIEQKLK